MSALEVAVTQNFARTVLGLFQVPYRLAVDYRAHVVLHDDASTAFTRR